MNYIAMILTHTWQVHVIKKKQMIDGIKIKELLALHDVHFNKTKIHCSNYMFQMRTISFNFHNEMSTHEANLININISI